MPKIPKKISNFLANISGKLFEILKDNLYGIYVFGSLTYGGFRPKSSDIDCVVITSKALSSRELRLLKNWHSRLAKQNPLSKRLEVSYAVKNSLISTSVAKTPKFFKQKFYNRSDSDANSPITWLNIRNSGITVFGPDPKTFVPNIQRETLRKALKTEFNYINKRPNKFLKEDWSKVYVILTFCRIIYTIKTNKIKSKKVAAQWCLNNLPSKWHPIITKALKAFAVASNWKCLCHPCHHISEESRKEIANFSKYVKVQLNKKM